jgi:hypothetical protein
LPAALLGRAKVAFLAVTSEGVKLRLTSRLPSGLKQKRETDERDFSHTSVVDEASKKARLWAEFSSATNDTVTSLVSIGTGTGSCCSLAHEASASNAVSEKRNLFITVKELKFYAAYAAVNDYGTKLCVKTICFPVFKVVASGTLFFFYRHQAIYYTDI